MKTYQSLHTLLQHVGAFDQNGAVFVNRAAWSEDPMSSQLLVLEGDDQLEDLADVDSHLPKEAASRDMHQLLDVQTLQDVVGFEQRRNPGSSPADVSQAINYYREADDFYDPERTG